MRQVEIDEIELKPFSMLDKRWALLVAGRLRANPMTVSWGGMGTLWNRPVITVYVRPTRFTCELLNEGGVFTLNFLPERYRSALNQCGAVSGRDHDKWALTGLHPEPSHLVAAPRVSEADLVFECRVMASFDFQPERFLDPSIEKLYPQRDYHRAFIGEVLAAWSQNNS